MKAVVQRVSGASVKTEGMEKGRIGFGLLVCLGVAVEDTAAEADWLAEKIIHLRIFDDADGKMNLSLADIVSQNAQQSGIGILVVSQFTLMGDARKGRRPSWAKAAPPEKAKDLYLYFIEKIRTAGFACECGEFQAVMKVTSVNEGPVTILLDS